MLPLSLQIFGLKQLECSEQRNLYSGRLGRRLAVNVTFTIGQQFYLGIAFQ